jgi:hypothetical protein
MTHRSKLSMLRCRHGSTSGERSPGFSLDQADQFKSEYVVRKVIDAVRCAVDILGTKRTLIYPIAVPAVCLVLSLFLMPETLKMSIWDEAVQRA